MNRQEALQFIRDNSRMIRSFHLNPLEKALKDDSYKPEYFEQRMGNNGTPFVLLDMADHGWELYFIAEGNRIDVTIDKFEKVTGALQNNKNKQP